MKLIPEHYMYMYVCVQSLLENVTISLFSDFVKDENDTEIKIRQIFVIMCAVFSVVMVLVWAVCAAIWNCFATTSGRKESER